MKESSYSTVSSLSMSALFGLIFSLCISFFLPLQTLWLIGFIISGSIFSIFLLQKHKIFISDFSLNTLKILLIFCVFFLFGLIRMEFIFQEKAQNHVLYQIGNTIEIQGLINEEVDIREKKVKYIVEVQSINNQKSSGKFLINTQKTPLYSYGDIIQVQGLLEEAQDDSDFSYKNYLERYEVYGIMNFPSIEKTGYEPESKFLAWIFQQKQSFLENIQEKYTEPYSSFLAGLLIGARKGMSQEIQNDFQVTGLSHIVAVSGSNITMMLAVFLTLFLFLPRFVAFILSISLIVIFTIFVGMSSAVVRAAIMGIIGLIAVQSGRPKAPFIALLTTISIMAFWQPKILLYDIGFQLSVAALIGVIWLVPLFPKFFNALPQHFGIKEAVAITLAAQITTLPVSAIHFQSFSLIAPIANLFVVPQIPFAMLFGFLSTLPLPFISDVFAFLSYLFLKLSLFFAHIFAQIPYASLQVHLPYKIWILYSLIILGLMLWFHKRKNTQ